jgi:hypothetical protein
VRRAGGDPDAEDWDDVTEPLNVFLQSLRSLGGVSSKGRGGCDYLIALIIAENTPKKAKHAQRSEDDSAEESSLSQSSG